MEEKGTAPEKAENGGANAAAESGANGAEEFARGGGTPAALKAVFVLFLLLVAGAEIALSRSWRPPRSPLEYLPGGAAVYAELTAPWTSSDFAALLDSGAWAWLCRLNDGKNVFSGLRELYGRLSDHEFRSRGGKILKALFGFEPLTYLGGRTGVALYGLKDGGPDFAAAVPLFLPLRAAGIERALSLLPEGASWKKGRFGSVGSPVFIYEITLPNGTRLYLTKREGALVVSSSRDRLRSFVEGNGKALASEAGFARALEWGGRRGVSFLFSPAAFAEKIVPALKAESTAGRLWKYFDKVFNKVAFDAFFYRYVELRLFTGGDGRVVSVRGRLYAPYSEQTDKSRIERPSVKDFGTAEVLPEDSFFALTWTKDVPALWQSILKEQTKEELEKIRKDPAAKVFEEEFFPAMAKVHCLALTPQTLDEKTAKKFPFPSLVLCFGLKDVKTFSDIVYDQVDKFMEELREEHDKSGEPMPFYDRRVNHDGVEINYFEIPDNPVMDAIVPCYAFVGNYWVISTSVEGAKKCVDALKKGRSLARSASFRECARRSYLPASGWIYFEPRRLALEFDTNATVWNENLLKIRPDDIPLPELRYRPKEQAEYQNEIRAEQLRRKKRLDRLCSVIYNLAPSFAAYRETEAALEWFFEINVLR